MVDDAFIRVKPLDGPWQTLGADRLRGIRPENIEASSDEWGPSALNYLLRAEDGAQRPDLLPDTPIELEIGGMLVWNGYIYQRPSDANGYSVGCRGWQFHLDDDLLDRVYVHTRLGDYRDQRTFLAANLADFHVAGVVGNDQGSILLGWPNGAVLAIGSRVGVTLDLGPDSVGKRVVFTWASTNNSATINVVVRGTDAENSEGTGESIITFAVNAGAAGTNAANFISSRRFIHIFLQSTAAQTLAADVHIQVQANKVFRNSADESGNASILKADTIVKDVLTLAPLLNQSTGKISAGTFSIPEYLTRGYLSPRQMIEAINAFENFRAKIGGEDLKTLVFDVKPSAALIEVGEWSGAEFSDASVSGEDIYTRAIIDATGPDGARLVSKRTQTGTLVDKRGFTRSKVLPVSAAVTQAVADRFGDLWLTEHKTAPFSGTLRVQGSRAVRRVLQGTYVPAHALLLASGEKIRLANRLDPDTGNWGRDGRIAGITYRHADRSTEISIDDRRANFEKILSRYGVLVDQLA